MYTTDNAAVTYLGLACGATRVHDGGQVGGLGRNGRSGIGHAKLHEIVKGHCLYGSGHILDKLSAARSPDHHGLDTGQLWQAVEQRRELGIRSKDDAALGMGDDVLDCVFAQRVIQRDAPAALSVARLHCLHPKGGVGSVDADSIPRTDARGRQRGAQRVNVTLYLSVRLKHICTCATLALADGAAAQTGTVGVLAGGGRKQLVERCNGAIFCQNWGFGEIDVAVRNASSRSVLILSQPLVVGHCARLTLDLT